MKNSTAKCSEPNGSVPFNSRWIRAVIFIMALLIPTGVVAQSYPADDQASPQQETEGYEQQETEGYEQQDIYQEQNTEPEELDYSNPYQQPAITELEQDQMDQAQSALGQPDSRRPEFNSFFDARDSAIISQEKLDLLKQDEGF